MRLTLLLLLILPIHKLIANPDIIIEPQVSIIGTGSFKDNSSPKKDLDLRGFNYGLKLGLVKGGIGFGIYHERGAAKLEAKGSSMSSTDYRSTATGICFGYRLPHHLKIWGGIAISSKYRSKDDSISDAITYSGKGSFIGIGYLLPMAPIQLNIKFKRNSLDEFNQYGTTTALTGDNEITAKELTIGVSIPFNI